MRAVVTDGGRMPILERGGGAHIILAPSGKYCVADKREHRGGTL